MSLFESPRITSDLESVHHYQGRALADSDLPFPHWRHLLERLDSNNEIYLKYYRYSKLEVTLSFAEYSRLSRQLACHLEESWGIRAGVPVVVCLENRFHALVCYGALLWLGAVIVPINPAETSDYVMRIYERVKATALVSDLNPNLSTPKGLHSILLNSEVLSGVRNRAITPRSDVLKLHSPAAVFFTSGTTGYSKGAVLSHGQLLINSKATQLLHRMDPESVHFCILPLFHVNAFSFSFLTNLYSGSRLILNQSFFQLSFWEELAKEKVNVVSLVPHVLRLLNLDKRFVDQTQLKSVKYFVTAAAPLSQGLLAEFYRRFEVPVVQAYGLSETVNFSLTVNRPLRVSANDPSISDEGPPSVGLPVFGNEVAVMDPNSGQLLGEGQRGEIVIRGWNVMLGYLNDPLSTQKAFEKGWFHTGDLGYFKLTQTNESQFYLVGRIKEIMKRAGELISLHEIDEQIHKIAGLENSVTVAFPNSFAGEELGLFVADSDLRLTAEEILKACSLALPAFKKPRAVAFGNSIPQSPTGKIQRHLLVGHFENYKDTQFR